MITYDMISEAMSGIVDIWGEQGKRVIEACSKECPYNDTYGAFVRDECIACGGNWGGMLLTGIKSWFPGVYKEIPDNIGGNKGFFAIVYTLILLGVDTSDGHVCS